jgi:hypothetical protein
LDAQLPQRTAEEAVNGGEMNRLWHLIEAFERAIRRQPYASDCKDDRAAIEQYVAGLENRISACVAAIKELEEFRYAAIRNELRLKDEHELALHTRTFQLAEARNGEERGKWMLNNCEWHRYEGDDRYKPYSLLCIRLPYDADLSCYAMRKAAIDAARKEEKHD